MGTQAVIVFIICATILIMFFGILFMMLKHKDKNLNLKSKGDLKNQSFEIDVGFNSNKTIEELENKVKETKKIIDLSSSPDEAVEKLNIDVVKNQDFKSTIAELNDFIIKLKSELKNQKIVFQCENIINNIIQDLIFNICVLVVKNHIGEIKNIEYNKYIEKFIDNLNTNINEELKESENEILKKYDVRTALEHDYVIYKTLIKYLFIMIREYHQSVTKNRDEQKTKVLSDSEMKINNKLYKVIHLLDEYYADLISVEIGVLRLEIDSIKTFLLGKILETLEKNNELQKDNTVYER